MRKVLALIVGVGMSGGGLYVLYSLFFKATKIPFMFVTGGGLLVVIGGYLVWEILRTWNTPLTKDN